MAATFHIQVPGHGGSLTGLAPVCLDKATLFTGSLEAMEQHLPRYTALVSEVEQERARKFVHEKDRNLYLISHGFLREQLALKLGVAPSALLIDFTPNCKPKLLNFELDFNLSHSHNVFAIAVANTTGIQVGVDVEKPKTSLDFAEILAHYFHPDEISYITDSNITKAIQRQRFYETWTRKEAFLKLYGIGIVAHLPAINTCTGNQQFQLEVPPSISIVNHHCQLQSFWLGNTPVCLAISSAFQ